MFRAYSRKIWPALAMLLSGAATRLGAQTSITPKRCEQFVHHSFEQARVLSASIMSAGTFLPPGMKPSDPDAGPYGKLPAFCRVVIEATPSSDSQLRIEVWLRVSGWNGEFRGQGNGGFAGKIDYHGMAGSLKSGYATAATDTGHTGEATDASWALNHPEKIIDFGYRGVHLMTKNAQETIASSYGAAPKRSYFDSCSDGGREALMEAQRFPHDYDGILAGAPANYWTPLLTAALSLQQRMLRSRSTYIPLDKVPAINDAVMKACDALDGVKDGIISDQERCRFDPQVLRCKSGENSTCLTQPQVDSLKAIYAGAHDKSGHQIFPPIMPGSEAGDGGWKSWVIGDGYETAEGLKYPIGFFKNMVYDDPHWNLHTADVEAAGRAADNKLAKILNSADPDLSEFEGRGGKLILYHGWLDAAISPLGSIRYYKSVTARMGQSKTESFVRLYMVPGMQHCAGGPGPWVFGQLGISASSDPAQNAFESLRAWVEKGVAPGLLVATKWNDDHDSKKGVLMTRPLCPWPQNAVYRGGGDSNQASSFACEAHNEEKTARLK